ncbi:MAG: flagellar basal body-associated FliL family protein [Burkholderiales bacterium]|nr:flagellar basal body-associated FliL family protein [Burkholderiales bacterium]
MKMTAKHFICLCALSFTALGASNQALANSGKSSASAEAGAPVARLEPFVVNLARFDRYLQAIITLQLGASEIGDKVKTYMPMVRHTIILTLSGKAYEVVQTSEGKKELIEELKTKLNKVLDVKEHDGVSDIFFENFVIQ